MEKKFNFVKNGVIRLPPGFRFHPTDEELVVQYLRRKVFCCPLPASIIPEVDVCKSDPWDLPVGDCGQERYFFSTREAKYPNGNRSNRATGSGYWKATGIDKQIVTSKCNQVVGMKKTLVFYKGKPPHGLRTDWIMHEYRLLPSETINSQKINTTQIAMENWVLCRIFLKKRSSKNEEAITQFQNCGRTNNNNCKENNKGGVIFYDFLAKDRRTDLNLAPVSSSSGSSVVTVVSVHELDHEHEEKEQEEGEEESSSCNSFSSFRRKP